MQLNSIFVGKPKDVPYNGKIISTSIYKELVSGPVRVVKHNIEGDQQANLEVHGGEYKAVYAYPVEHYDFWRNSRADLSFEPGVFGENLSVSGLFEDEVNVGDVYKIGTATFAVTTPRLPCFKLGIKMNDPGIIKDFMAAMRSGFYLKVVEEGVIEAGDEIVLLKKDDYGLTIKELVKLQSTDKSNKQLLKKAIEAPALQKDWVDSFKEKLDKLK
ncbi:MOSC domain-containing protein [Marinigracilibium pacificum]|uniref:MOSC domain-containing protein n=1 Tax=Marinigracilibium pacificum TaxID=2729599 RepID=A0A848J795_9BACT|nr:MOSC domain-containing protein [Marinigracilibium pacificum]NMM50370.1 MOSC domain-containing protein [Marinigracilibium pacificum]